MSSMIVEYYEMVAKDEWRSVNYNCSCVFSPGNRTLVLVLNGDFANPDEKIVTLTDINLVQPLKVFKVNCPGPTEPKAEPNLGTLNTIEKLIKEIKEIIHQFDNSDDWTFDKTVNLVSMLRKVIERETDPAIKIICKNCQKPFPMGLETLAQFCSRECIEEFHRKELEGSELNKLRRVCQGSCEACKYENENCLGKSFEPKEKDADPIRLYINRVENTKAGVSMAGNMISVIDDDLVSKSELTNQFLSKLREFQAFVSKRCEDENEASWNGLARISERLEELIGELEAKEGETK